MSERERIERVYAGYTPENVRGRWSLDNPGNRHMVRQRAELMTGLLGAWRPQGLQGTRVLDLGCGDHSISCPAIDDADRTRVTRLGVDIIFDRTVEAVAAGTFEGVACADGSALPLRSGTIDLVLVFTVFSSIADDAICAAIGCEIVRVLRPGGAVLWYDLAYPNPSNRNVRPIDRKAVQAFFPGLVPTWRRTTLVPPLARRLGRFTDALYPRLSRLPILTSHHLGLLRATG